MEDIQERMVARLRHLGIKVNGIEEDDRCVLPMDGPLPLLPQRVVGIGGTAGMVHPSTGCMIARTLAAAPVVANSIVEYLGPIHGLLGDELSSRVWKGSVADRGEKTEGVLLWHGCPAQTGLASHKEILRCVIRFGASVLARLPVIEVDSSGACAVWAFFVLTYFEYFQVRDHVQG
ncbi:unnamed protein product [Musa hybrid cultivar]